MKLKHTPGPWKSFYKIKYDEWHVAIPDRKSNMLWPLFKDGVPGDFIEEREANARLIASAPEMLNLFFELFNDLECWREIQYDYRLKIVKVIEKATGMIIEDVIG